MAMSRLVMAQEPEETVGGKEEWTLDTGTCRTRTGEGNRLLTVKCSLSPPQLALICIVSHDTDA